ILANHEQPWYTHDVSLSCELPIARTAKLSPRLHLAVEINNMLNQQYDVILNYPMPGINGKGIVKIII
ncbi:MAG: hypothetical protein IKS01_03445, partial [Paludibacteraceae bacterium]|nr:hypothetical protein [Paludibacteraceae bacterium]